MSNSYDSSRSALEGLINEHNKALPKGTKRIDVKAVMNKVITEGGTSLPGLRAFEKQDFIEFGLPRALAVQAVDALRPATKPAKAEGQTSTQTASAAPAAVVLRSEGDAVRALGVVALVDAYDPSNPGLVGDELNNRACGQPFLVFTDTSGMQLDRKSSADRLQSIIDGIPVTDHVMVNGEPMMPFRVGERPNVFLAENPLYTGRPLRQPGDVCDMTNESWTDIPIEVRVLLAVAVSSGELRISDPERARSVIEAARTENALVTLKSRYPRSASALRDMTPAERPTLQINVRRQSPAGVGTTLPFPRSKNTPS